MIEDNIINKEENEKTVLTDEFEIFVQGVFMHNSISLRLPAF